MQFLIEYGLWSIPLLWILHEGGHYLSSLLLTGKGISFYWHMEFYIVPVGTWWMPQMLPKWKKNIIYFSGFGLEFIAIPFLPPVYGICAVIHFITYFKRYNNGEARFFKSLLRR